MGEYSIYVLKTANESEEYPPTCFLESLQTGLARFGWGYSLGDSRKDDANLARLRKKKDEGVPLDGLEMGVWEKTSFLLNVKAEDYLVYVNVPTYGECTVARVQSTYRWLPWGKDFGHAIPVYADSIRSFNRNDRQLHPSLSRRFKLQRRWYRIYLKSEFEQLLDDLQNNSLTGERADAASRRGQLAEALLPQLDETSQMIHQYHPGKDLEELVAHALNNVPGVLPGSVKRNRGRADCGADVEFEFAPDVPYVQSQRYAVQIKSYEGVMTTAEAIEDIERAFRKDNTFDGALIISTATTIGDKFSSRMESLGDEEGRPIKVLYGADLARWLLKYGIF